jgi:hypothetical protein
MRGFVLGKIIPAGLALAVTLVCAASAAAQGNSQLQALAGFTAADLRAAIAKSGDIAITREADYEGEAVWAIAYEGINTAIVLNCPTETAGKCLSVAFLTGYPTQISADAFAVNELNRTSRFGWLASHSSGRVAFGHGVILAGMSLDGFLQNIRLNAAAYVVRGQDLIASPRSVSLPGLPPADPREFLIDAEHRPQARLGQSEALALLFEDETMSASLVNALKDAQSLGELRKIANDLLGE